MNTDDNTILGLTPIALMSRDLFLSLLEIQEPEERARIQALAEIRAEELGIKQKFLKVMKAYNQADRELAEEYKKQNAESHTNIQLDFDSNGKPLSTIDNFLQIFENDPKFNGLKFNLLTYAPEQERDGKTYRWLDSDDAEARHYIEKKYKIHNQQKCDDALRIIFAQNQYHPIRDLIDNFKWDGIERIPTFLHKWTKCEDTPYTREVSRLIFAGGIHRLYSPGCKYDDMPVLIGTRQGEGKSTLIRWIALKDEYFAEVNDFDGQKGIESLEGAWICEVSEMLALTKAREQEAVKSFLTRMNDRYRMPFDKRVTDHPRQCMFIGTTNKEQFLTDKTGNRRFYPVKVNQSGYELFDHKEEIMSDIRQCWAEALHKLQAGEMMPYADRQLTDVIRRKQAEAVEDDYRVGMIEGYLENHTEVCILELWQKALDMGEYSKPTKKDSNEIGLIMQAFDGAREGEAGRWRKQEKVKRFKEYGVQMWWKKDEEIEDLAF